MIASRVVSGSVAGRGGAGSARFWRALGAVLLLALGPSAAAEVPRLNGFEITRHDGTFTIQLPVVHLNDLSCNL